MRMYLLVIQKGLPSDKTVGNKMCGHVTLINERRDTRLL